MIYRVWCFSFGYICCFWSPFEAAWWWLAPSPHSESVLGSTPGWGLSVGSLHVLYVYACVLSGYSSFLPLSKNMHVGLIGVSKIVPRSECVWLFVLWLCDGLPTCPASCPMTAGTGIEAGIEDRWMDGHPLYQWQILS